MAHYVQVLNGLVVNMWDSPPRVPIGEDGWKNAIQDIPTINDQKQYYGQYTFDITKDPVVISREVFSYTVEERKQNLRSTNEFKFRQFVDMLSKNPNLYSQSEIDNIKNIANTNKTAINSANTHNDLDQLSIIPIELF